MIVFRVTAAIMAFVAVWCLGGTVVTSALAWINARAGGEGWFSPDRSRVSRWSKGTSELPPAVLVFILWPLAIPIGLLWVIGNGFARLTEKIGDKVIALAERQAKAVRE